MKNKFYSIICLLLVSALCIAMSACSNGESKQNSQADYKLIRKNGACFIEFENLSTYQNGACQIGSITFDTVKEFKDSVTKGLLTEGQKEIMASSFERDSTGAIKVCDFDDLRTPKLPDDGSVSKVVWSGQAYSFAVSFGNNASGWLGCLTESQYNERYQRDYLDLFNRDTITVTKTETLEDGKVATYYTTQTAQLMNIRYTLETDDQTIIVDKRFRLQTDTTLSTSATIPSLVYMYCTSEEGFYYVSLSGFTQDPADEWLASFGLQKYVDNDHVAK